MGAYIGGIASFFGPIFGAGLLHVFDELTSRYTERVDLVNGIIFILVVMYAPYGAVGLWWSIKARLFKSKLREA
jgi:branched-chain amino acid transport system permease protein